MAIPPFSKRFASLVLGVALAATGAHAETFNDWMSRGHGAPDVDGRAKAYLAATQSWNEGENTRAELADAWVMLSSNLFLLREYAAALKAAESGIEASPLHARAYKSKGQALAALHRYQEQVAADEKALRLTLKREESLSLGAAHANLCAALTSLGSYERALRHCGSIPADMPDLGMLYSTRGELYLRLGRTAEAKKQFEGMLRHAADKSRMATDDPRASESALGYLGELGRIGLAETACREGRCDEALTAFSDVLKRYPGWEAVHWKRGRAYAKTGRCDLAIRDFGAALEKDPNFAEAYADRGACRASQGDVAGARGDFDRALAITPFVDGLFQRGTFLLGQAEPKEADKDFTRALALRKDFPDAYLARGRARRLLGQAEGASTDFKKACRLGLKEACR